MIEWQILALALIGEERRVSESGCGRGDVVFPFTRDRCVCVCVRERDIGPDLNHSLTCLGFATQHAATGGTIGKGQRCLKRESLKPKTLPTPYQRRARLPIAGGRILERASTTARLRDTGWFQDYRPYGGQSILRRRMTRSKTYC